MQSSEFLTNMKDIPTKDSRDYDAFWENEKHKFEYGLTVNGVYIPAWLYWHTQIWKIFIDEEDKSGKVPIVKRVFKNAEWRDNEWMIAEAYEEAQAKKQGLMIFGSRRLGKSEYLGSHIGRYSTLYHGSENVITGGNWGDIDVIMFKLTQGLNHLPDYFKFGRLAENLRKEVELGFKDKKGTRLSWSKIIARNHEEGNDTECLAGLTSTTFTMDEVGKSKFIEVLEAGKPSFTSPYGWRCVPILTGTSGDIKKNSDAQKYFENPEAYNFLMRELKEEGGKKVSLFISGLRRMEGKVQTTLGDYAVTEKGILVPKESELFKIPFLTTDEQKATAIIDQERLIAGKSSDPAALLKQTMYYPKDTKELFLSDDGNNFPIDALKEHLAYLEANEELQGRPCRLYRDVQNKVNISFNTNKKPIIDFPLKDFSGIKKDAPVVIYDPPMDDVYTYLHISGADPYNQSASKWSSSLGSIYIFKRVYDVIGGSYQRRIVAEYTARPETMKEFHETCEMLLELYSAICLPENEAQTFIQYFDLKNKGYLLADGYSFLKEIQPNTSITGRNKGLPATVKVQSFYKELIFQYLTEELVIDYREDGTPIKKLGLVRIPSIGLIKELIAFNDKGNFDRYVAFGHVLAHEVWADKIYPFVDLTEKKEKIPIKTSTIQSPFTKNKGPFSMGSKNAFGI